MNRIQGQINEAKVHVRNSLNHTFFRISEKVCNLDKSNNIFNCEIRALKYLKKSFDADIPVYIISLLRHLYQKFKIHIFCVKI